VLARGTSAFNRLEEADELLMPVALHVAANEAAGRAGCVECVAGRLVRPATLEGTINA
jgi:hypothetical protein